MNSRLSHLLRWTSGALLVAALALWVGTGAHRGWTQTSLVTMQRDEITGIDYPVRRDGFVAGLEIPAAAGAIALALTAASFVRRRPAASAAA